MINSLMATWAKVFRGGTLQPRILLLAVFAAGGGTAVAQESLPAVRTVAATSAMPWMDRSLPPDRRAQSVLAQMTLEEKIRLLHGSLGFVDIGETRRADPGALGGDGFVPGIERLGIPPLQLIGAGVGVTNMGRRRNGEATAMPSSVALAASWDTDAAQKYGAVIGQETREKGFNVSLGGGVDIAREATNGRNFEYHGEDPLLAGKMVASEIRAIQAQGVIATVKHYAANYQETDRFGLNALIDERTLHEVDLLPFEIAVREGGVGAVMCAYNKINGDYACENSYLLNDVLRQQWGFKGWVLSDWGATHSTVRAANAGLDQEFYENQYFSEALASAVHAGQVSMGRIDSMALRILRTMFAVGIIDRSAKVEPSDTRAHARVAQEVAEQGAVLLKNSAGTLPLDASALKSIAIIGGRANLGVMSGGGSARVDPVGGSATGDSTVAATDKLAFWRTRIWVPSSPLKAIQERAPLARISYDDGSDLSSAARLAATSQVVILFVTQYATEGTDLPDLHLPDNQDELVSRVTAANPNTVVVMETGGAVLVPWADNVRAILEVWYPGQRGGDAVADLLFGLANPSGKLPLTFPRRESDLPRSTAFGYRFTEMGLNEDVRSVTASYAEGASVGYRWFQSKGRTPAFAFGYGLSYTQFRYTKLALRQAKELSASFDLTNTGPREGMEIVQLYVRLPANAQSAGLRLAGWSKVRLKPGETRRVTIEVEPRMLMIWDVARKAWARQAGAYAVLVGSSSDRILLRDQVELSAIGARAP